MIFRFVAVFFYLLPFSVWAALPTPPILDSPSWVLMSYESGQVLASKNPNSERAPASLTKIMTVYTIAKELQAGHTNLDDIVIISTNAESKKFPGSSLMQLKANEKVSVNDLLKGLIVSSGNDASVALAEHLTGHPANFIQLMNNYAEQLGMKHTYFTNPHGLDSAQQMTTALDMAKLTQAMIQEFPDIYALFKEKTFTYQKVKHVNRNRLLWEKQLSVDGVKTGYTSNAGYNLVSSAAQPDQRLIAVIMGSKTPQIRQRESKKLLQWGYRFFKNVPSPLSATELDEYKVWYGSPSHVPIKAAQNTLTIPRHQTDNLHYEVQYRPFLNAPLSAGSEIGEIHWFIGTQKIATQPLLTQTNVQRGQWPRVLLDKALRPASEWWYKMKNNVNDKWQNSLTNTTQ